jgi:hypothetical protein
VANNDIFPESYESQHELRTKTGDGLDMVISVGYARFAMKGSPNWNRQNLILVVGPGWAAPRAVVPVVSLSSIMNVNVANNAGWAVDTVDVTFDDSPGPPPGVQVRLTCGLAVRDSDGWMFRVNYHVTTIGRLA